MRGWVWSPVEHLGKSKAPRCYCMEGLGGSPVMQQPSLRRSWGGGFALLACGPAERWAMGPDMTPSHVAMAALGPGESF